MRIGQREHHAYHWRIRSWVSVSASSASVADDDGIGLAACTVREVSHACASREENALSHPIILSKYASVLMSRESLDIRANGRCGNSRAGSELVAKAKVVLLKRLARVSLDLLLAGEASSRSTVRRPIGGLVAGAP